MATHLQKAARIKENQLEQKTWEQQGMKRLRQELPKVRRGKSNTDNIKQDENNLIRKITRNKEITGKIFWINIMVVPKKENIPTVSTRIRMYIWISQLWE